MVSDYFERQQQSDKSKQDAPENQLEEDFTRKRKPWFVDHISCRQGESKETRELYHLDPSIPLPVASADLVYGNRHCKGHMYITQGVQMKKKMDDLIRETKSTCQWIMMAQFGAIMAVIYGHMDVSSVVASTLVVLLGLFL